MSIRCCSSLSSRHIALCCINHPHPHNLIELEHVSLHNLIDFHPAHCSICHHHHTVIILIHSQHQVDFHQLISSGTFVGYHASFHHSRFGCSRHFGCSTHHHHQPHWFIGSTSLVIHPSFGIERSFHQDSTSLVIHPKLEFKAAIISS